MALDQNAQYPVGTAAPTAAYPEGSAINETALDALDGYPWEKENINDKLGFQQALLRVIGQAASGNADTALVSQYLQGIIELASGRAFNYDDSGAVNAHVLDIQANQQGPASLFDGFIAEFIVGTTNTTSATVNVDNKGVKAIVDTLVAGTLTAGERIKIRYRLATDDFEIINTSIPVITDFINGLSLSNAADADHDIAIAAGEASDSLNTVMLNLTSSITKQIDAVWSVGDNAGGLFSGAVAATTLYHLFLIKKDSDETIDAGFDTSITAANIPAGYTAFRRIGYLHTDGSSNIDIFTGIDISSKVVQVVQVLDGEVSTGSTTIPRDDTIPQSAEGNEVMTIPLVPTNVDNNIEIEIVVFGGHSAGSGSLVCALFQDATANALAAATNRFESASTDITVSFNFVKRAGSIADTTFKVRAGSNAAGTFTFNGTGGSRVFGGVMASSIIIREVKP